MKKKRNKEKRKHGEKWGKRGESVSGGTEAGRRDRTFQTETCRRRTKKKNMSLSGGGFLEAHDGAEASWMLASAETVKKKKKAETQRCPPSPPHHPRTHADPQAGLGAPFLGCARAEPPLPSAPLRSTQRFFFPRCIRASKKKKNTSLDHH